MADDNTTPEPQERRTVTLPPNRTLLIIGGVIVGAVLIFMAGGAAQRHRQREHMLQPGMRGVRILQGEPGGGIGLRRNTAFHGSVGKVTAVDSSSITIQNERTGASTKYTINGSTKVVNDGATAKAEDIKVGDTVVVRPDDQDTNTAADILIMAAGPTTAPSGSQSSY